MIEPQPVVRHGRFFRRTHNYSGRSAVELARQIGSSGMVCSVRIPLIGLRNVHIKSDEWRVWAVQLGPLPPVRIPLATMDPFGCPADPGTYEVRLLQHPSKELRVDRFDVAPNSVTIVNVFPPTTFDVASRFVRPVLTVEFESIAIRR